MADLRTEGTKAAVGLAERSESVMARGRKVAKTARNESEKVARTLADTVSDDAGKVAAQVESSVQPSSRPPSPSG